MASDRLYHEEYICGTCGVRSKHLIWESQLAEKVFHCETDNTQLTIFEEENKGGDFNVTFINKMSPAQIKADRKQRSTNHFKKEVLPTFEKGSDEHRHFGKKYGLKD